MINAGIVGGTGYTGVELLRLLAGHPDVSLQVITSRTKAGTAVDAVFPNLRGVLDLTFSAPDTTALHDCDVVFFATPNGTAMAMAPALIEHGVRVIDLGADFRIHDLALWSRWYGMTHECPELAATAVYGLPERNREDIRHAQLLANPGCYPTAVQLGLMPLLEASAVDTTALIADAKSGASGAGRQPKQHTLLCEAAENFHAYGAGGHRHLPEIQQGLAKAAGAEVGLTFVPHLVPMIRGIHATLYARLHDPELDLQALFETRYGKEPFVDVLAPDSHPETRTVTGSNMVRIAVHRPIDSDMAVVLVVEDNLVKGAAGQAVQNMNLMFGLAETAGLWRVPVLP
ncbi:MAG: N-acetyl-gamma-glutamyl-phosphate reductase [Spiribacter sp.]|jgi:N-acetyl-gamma-glutamyl-phosphate reductase|nr:N-acetyl-gamma-glutamyl-phosphate reductase [Spiribacter sp.]MDR9489838.1 N-acetyl-gamma-glutamyl-phosphate reductase [Spiribacter sp.]